MNWSARVLASISMAVPIIGGGVCGATFQELIPAAPNTNVFARGISADGQVVVGSFEGPHGVEAFRWSRESGIVGLGDLPTGPHISVAYACSADGSVIVGMGSPSEEFPSTRETFRWTAETGMVGLGDLPPGGGSDAQGVSADGNVITGLAGYSGRWKPFIWTPETGMTRLFDGVTGRAVEGWAWEVSADGSTIVGGGFISRNGATQSIDGNAYAVSADGSVAVGYRSDGRTQATRWEGDSWFSLGSFADTPLRSEALAVSADGSVIVGYTEQGGFIWDEQHGMRHLRTVLETEYGLDLTGWSLQSPWAISADGLTIAGVDVTPDGSSSRSWIVAIPEPSTWRLLITAGLIFGFVFGCATTNRRRSRQ